MSKRRVERDVEELEEEVLEELTPEERLQLWLEAAATENEVWLERLRETAPTTHYWSTDLAFVERGRAALKLLDQAMYDLHTTCLQYELVAKHQRMMGIINLLRDVDLTDEHLAQLEENSDDMDFLFADLYAQYHSYRRFATEILGVPLETWVALHPDGDYILSAVEEALDDDFQAEMAEEWLNETLHTDGGTLEDDEWVTLEAGVEGRYRAHVSVWEKMQERIP